MTLEQKIKLYVETGIPVLLEGPPGIGKTARVEKLAEAEGWHLEVLPLNTMEPPDIGGIPYVHEGVMHFSTPVWAQRVLDAAAEGKRPVIFLDEMNTVPYAMQSVALKLVRARYAGTIKLPDDTGMIAAINPPGTTSGTWDVASALSNRFAHITIAPNLDEWTAWAVKQGPGHARVAAFLRSKPSLLFKQPKNAAEAAQPWPSPRTWGDHVAHLIHKLAGAERGTIYEVAAEQVGEGAAAELAAWLQRMNLIDPEAALQNPQGFEIPKEEDIAFSLVYEAASLLEKRPVNERWLAYWEVLVRILEAGYQDIAATGASLALDIFRRVGRKNKLAIPKVVTRFGDYVQNYLQRVRNDG